MWLLVKFAWPSHLEGEIEAKNEEDATLIPAIVVFIYLATVLYIGIFAFVAQRTRKEGRRLLSGQSFARSFRFSCSRSSART